MAESSQPDSQKEVSVVLRVRLEIILSALLGALTILTAIWPDWIESLTGWDPDGGDGKAEWLMVLVFAVITVAAAALARRDLRVVRRRTSMGTQ
jgi:hypothetical protein